ncbi:ABC transporter ATP-binding protein [Mesorhizobium sp. CO1-1-8]|uniref:ABC transporter ATP-binding protein n=1 Tax=Mesorhizobium sp. CO1-1-8 TaxID=2876631 RepID=UPI001CD05639|nr:ABC transporter ATP-binding protein [Mesorhizobium sp. CO1-1-8]MBZ9772685.1 ABC transporter ATP-binding protein [Mesorhizobium sp. CO1-1-8]
MDRQSSRVLLKTVGLTKAFRGLVALRDHSIELHEGEIVGVIGPNGSGKSTLFNLITGFSQPNSGSIEMEGRSIVGLRTSQIVAMGIARTFQGSRLFGSLSVAQNVLTAAQLRHPVGPADTVLRGRRYRERVAATRQKADELLDLMGLTGQAGRVAADLPYGDQRRLEIARALATGPQLLLLDEPAAGLDSNETKVLAALIRTIRDRYGVTVVVVEHDMDLIMALCERIQVLATGEVICVGTPEQVREHPKVREAYLGHA